MPNSYHPKLTVTMRHSMPIVTPRLVLRPPTLDDLDAIQAAKENAWDDLQQLFVDILYNLSR